MSKNLFITGTGTDVGKTYVSALIVKKLVESGQSVGYYKAAMSGNTRDENGRLVPGDALKVKTFSNSKQTLKSMCPYVYEAAYSPHLASRLEGNHVKYSEVEKTFKQVASEYDYLTVEGSGGIICPLNFDGEKLLLCDLVKKLNLSCIIVASAGLGTINSVVLTVEFMRAKNIPVKGIVYNNFLHGNVMEEDNVFMCETLTGVKTLARIGNGDTDIKMTLAELTALYE